jgi:hypothetical protein
MQTDQGVWVVDHAAAPDRSGANGHPNFFLQLAAQRLLDTLARFQLAAGELPVTRVGLARRTGGEQVGTIGSAQNAHRNFDDLA